MTCQMMIKRIVATARGTALGVCLLVGPLAYTAASPAVAQSPVDLEVGAPVAEATDRQKAELYRQLSTQLMQPVDRDLADQLESFEQRQTGFIHLLTQCIRLEPTNRQEERIAATSARLLGRYRGPNVLRQLASNIDLNTRRFVEEEALSEESLTPELLRTYPCADSLRAHGEAAVEPLIAESLRLNTNRSDIQLELAAYVLLEIRYPREVREDPEALPRVRNDLLTLVDEQFRELQRTFSGGEQRINRFKAYLEQIEPVYYRYPEVGKKHGMQPAEGSVIFGVK